MVKAPDAWYISFDPEFTQEQKENIARYISGRYPPGVYYQQFSFYEGGNMGHIEQMERGKTNALYHESQSKKYPERLGAEGHILVVKKG